MHIPLQNYLLVPLFVGFAGSLSFNPINLCVVDTTVRHNVKAGLLFALAATIVEGVHAWIAVYFGDLYPLFMKRYPWVSLIAMVFFVAVGISFLRRSASRQTEVINPGNGGHFLQGLIIGLMNPQGIPYWILVLSYLQSAGFFEIHQQVSQTGLILFLSGVMTGKFGALLLFGLLSDTINRRTAFLQQWTDKITGGVLIALGLLQALPYFFA